MAGRLCRLRPVLCWWRQIEALSVQLDARTVNAAAGNLSTLSRAVKAMEKTDAQRLQQEYNNLLRGLTGGGGGGGGGGAHSAAQAADASTDEKEEPSSSSSSSLSSSSALSFPSASADRLMASPVLPSDVLREAVPGNIRRAKHFLLFLRSWVEFIKQRLLLPQVSQETPTAFLADLQKATLLTDTKALRFAFDRLQSLFQTLKLTDLDDYTPLSLLTTFATVVSTYNEGFMVIFEPFDERNPAIPDPKLELCCLPEQDTRLLTQHGFLFLSEIEALIDDNQLVLYACYDTATQGIVYRAGDVVYAYTPGVDDPAAAPKHWVDFTQAETRRWWDATSDDYDGSTVAADGDYPDRLTLRTTAEHQMYVQLCTVGGAKGDITQPRKAGGAAISPHKMSARELAPGYQCDCTAKRRSCTHGYSDYRMCTGAAAGLLVAPADAVSLTDLDPRSPVVALGLYSKDALDAFLELFGYWLGDGRMEYDSVRGRTSQNAVVFSPKKRRDRHVLLRLLARLRLVRDTHYTRSRSKALELTVRITDLRWFRFFDDEFGVQYSGSRHYDRRLALLKQGMQPSQRRPLSASAQSPSSSSVVRCPTLSVGVESGGQRGG